MSAAEGGREGEEKKRENKEVRSILGFLISKKSCCEKERGKKDIFRATRAV